MRFTLSLNNCIKWKPRDGKRSHTVKRSNTSFFIPIIWQYCIIMLCLLLTWSDADIEVNKMFYYMLASHCVIIASCMTRALCYSSFQSIELNSFDTDFLKTIFRLPTATMGHKGFSHTPKYNTIDHENRTALFDTDRPWDWFCGGWLAPILEIWCNNTINFEIYIFNVYPRTRVGGRLWSDNYGRRYWIGWFNCLVGGGGRDSGRNSGRDESLELITIHRL